MEKKPVAATNEIVIKYISDDLAFSILSKLPLKSLKLFGCVRKSWSLLFENTHFMNMFRGNFSSNLHCCSYYDQGSLILKLVDHNHDQQVENKVKLDFSNPFSDKSYFDIFGFGSINGIVCLHQLFYCKLVLWNPTTNEYKLIPPSPFESSVPDNVKFANGVVINLQGFGYDHITNDYKVIRSASFPPHNDVDSLWEIYSLQSNSWRKLDIDPPWMGGEDTKLYLDGVCHWLYQDKSGSSGRLPCLVSFYLSNDVLCTTRIPSDLDDWFDGGILWLRLVVLNGSITFISYHEKTATLQITILGELGIKESWTKLFIVAPLPCVERPLGVGTKGEILFLRKDGELAWFDLSTNMIGEFGCKAMSYGCQIVIYKESILPLGGINN